MAVTSSSKPPIHITGYLVRGKLKVQRVIVERKSFITQVLYSYGTRTLQEVHEIFCTVMEKQKGRVS